MDRKSEKTQNCLFLKKKILKNEGRSVLLPPGGTTHIPWDYFSIYSFNISNNKLLVSVVINRSEMPQLLTDQVSKVRQNENTCKMSYQ